MTPSDSLRIGQRVCRVEWNEGVPFVRFGTVVRRGKSGCCYVGDDKKSKDWFATFDEAIKSEYQSLFLQWDLLFGHAHRDFDWTVDDTVRCVCEVRRLQRRFSRSARRQKVTPRK
jgi:hypothetical protein